MPIMADEELRYVSDGTRRLKIFFPIWVNAHLCSIRLTVAIIMATMNLKIVAGQRL
jgi:hypothetical protein